MNTLTQPLRFYQFLGCHSFLIGLLPFYLPVFLWGNGFELSQICFLIGVSGLSFCAALSVWQTLSTTRTVNFIFAITFLFECALVALALRYPDGTSALSGLVYLIGLGVLNGLYNAFFWTTQRTLFLQLLGRNDTGRQYGNFQIFVTVFLKLGILLGGWLLAQGGGTALLFATVLVALVSVGWFHFCRLKHTLHKTDTITLHASIRFRDQYRSQTVFIADGFFLFLESHFWTLSLFLIAGENYARFGVVVVILALIFALLFYVLKNTIDRFAGQFIFSTAVVLYALSWALRGFVDTNMATQWLLMLLVIITFCSSFFRLAFNKRFFDIATANQGVQYLVIKSYVSQLYLGTGFIALGVGLWLLDTAPTAVLTATYWSASVLSLIYLRYRNGGVTHR